MKKGTKKCRKFACRFEDNGERIQAIREFVGDSVIVGVNYSDRENPTLRLYRAGEEVPFATGEVGDYVVNDNGTIRIMSDASEMTDVMLNQK